MIAYSPESEAGSERFFHITVEDNYGTKMIKARVIRRCQADLFNEAGNRIRYLDGSKPGIEQTFKYASWSSDKKSAVRVEDLVVSAYLPDRDSTSKTIYGVRALFEAHFVELSDAKQIANTLTKIDASLTKQVAEYGYLKGEDYAGYLIRVAKALGIKQFLTYREENRRGFDEENFRFHGAAYLEDNIQRYIEKVVGK